MQISTTDQQVLTLAVAEAVRDAEVSESGTVFPKDLVVPDVSEPLSKRLKRTFDRGGLRVFAESIVHRKVLGAGFSCSDDEYTALRSIDGLDDHVEIAKHVVSELEKIPYRYTVFVRGPAAMSEATKKINVDIKISDQLRLISSESLRESYPFLSGDDAVDDWVWSRRLSVDGRRFATKYLYFVYNAVGFIGPDYSSKILEAISDEMRAFYGACLAHDLFYPIGYKRDQLSLIFLSEHGDGMLHPHRAMDGDLDRATHFYGGPQLQSEYRKSAKFDSALAPVIKLFNCQNSGRLKTAAMWLLRALSSQKPLDRVLESAITLEVLLGDREMSDRVGLTKLMANRCAYALGKSSSERESTLKFFQDFYRLRSDIVHTGRLVLGEDEETLVDQGLKLASSMLVYEQALSC